MKNDELGCEPTLLIDVEFLRAMFSGYVAIFLEFWWFFLYIH